MKSGNFKQQYQKQDGYVRRQLDVKLPCPVCNTGVSLIEQQGQQDNHTGMFRQGDWDCSCPTCATQIVYTLSAFAPPQFIVKPGTAVHWDQEEMASTH